MANLSYQSLESPHHIRLLKLLPGDHEATISTELVHVILEHARGNYEALSYTWGTDEPSNAILCNSRKFGLRQNAHDLLRRLRHSDESRWLWMDCVCINQNDITEREEQVKIMHLIYAQSRSVCIWLGRDGDDSSVAMRYAAQLDVKTHTSNFGTFTFSGNSKLIFHSKAFLFDDYPETEWNKRLFDALKALMQRSWLKRVWVQQEAALGAATRVLCGKDEITWDHFFSLAWILTKRTSMDCPEWIYEPLSSIEPALVSIRNIQASRITHLKLGQPRQHELLTASSPTDTPEERMVRQQALEYGPTATNATAFIRLAVNCSGCEATDPRDKLYALFNLATDDVHGGDKAAHRTEIDYHASWQTVYTRVAKRMYGNAGGIQVPSSVLEHAGRSMQHGIEVPSWVPDWRQSLQRPFLEHSGWFAGGAAYPPNIKFLTVSKSCLGNHFRPPYRSLAKDGRSKRVASDGMELTALLVDRIVYRSPQTSLDAEYLRDDAEKLQAKIKTDFAYIRQNIPRYFTGDTGFDAYAGALIANTDHRDNISTAEYERNRFAEFYEWLGAGCPSPAPRLEYYEALQNSEVFWRNAFSVTAHGIMCVSTKMIQAGDFIAIISGIRYPVALRKVGPENQQYFELLGTAYLHRMMRGRVWNLMEEFKCKYVPGSEVETQIQQIAEYDDGYSPTETCESFPFNPKSDYRRVLRVLGKRKIVLV